MSIIVREYRANDYADVRKLYGELAQHHAEIYGDPSIAGEDAGRGMDGYLKRNNRIGEWVAEDKGKPIGFIGLLETIGEEGVAEIEPLVVSAAFRSKGIGSKLVEHVKAEAKKKGYRFLTIRPELRNKEAFKLYVRLGFDMVGEVELFQDLEPEEEREWEEGVEILGQKLKY